MTARGQQAPVQTAPSNETAAPGQQNTNPDYDRMDQFLNDHKDIDKDLKAKPSLINDQKYLGHHKELRTFLEQHPEMQREFAQNPTYFANREGRFNARDARTNQNSSTSGQQTQSPRNQDQDRDRNAGVTSSQNGNAANSNPDRDQDQNVRDRDQDRGGQGQNPGLRNGEAAQLDQFLDTHQQIQKDLTANPSLANNNTYLDQHQDFRTFLNAHPDLQQQFAKNPTFFMQRENQFDAREDARSRTNQNAGQPNRNTNPNANQNAGVTSSQNGSATNSNPDRDQDRNRNFTDRDQDRDRFANGQNPQNGANTNSNPDRDQDRNGNFSDRDQDRDRFANGQNPNPDLRNREVARMDQFLDDHQQIDKDLTAKPTLINDQKYLSQHKDLQLFLNNHPQVREEFAENPTYFMHREQRFDAREDARSRTNPNANQNAGQPNRNANADRDRNAGVTNSQNGNMTNGNPDRDQDRDRNFTDRDQDRDRFANGQNPNPDLRNGEVARMDQFLDDHQQIDKDLTAKPSLINDQKYLGQHKDLQLFLNNHPQVHEEFAENPAYFMHREDRFDARESAGRVDANRNSSRTTSSNVAANANLTDKQAAQMDRFLDKHKDIDKDLSANPSLCKDDKYLHHHKDLRVFLNKNPEVRTQLASNSSYFAQRHERMQGHAPVNRAKSAKPAPAKTPVEQHETTSPATPH
jgi:hypothetical protein